MNYESLTKHLNRLGSTEKVVVTTESIYLSGFEDTKRMGEPTTWIRWQNHKDDIALLLEHYRKSGYGKDLPKIDKRLEAHVRYFRATLDIFEALCPKGVYTKDEYYYRSLEEGHLFTKEIKRRRADYLRESSKHDQYRNRDIEVPKSYKGYDSILHERYLIHWDDSSEVEDLKYAFIPVETEIDTSTLRSSIIELLRQDGITSDHFEEYVSYIDSIKNTKMYNPHTREVSLVRDILAEDTGLRGGYLAKRAVVPTYPGSTRDTGIGDPFTIMKVKALNTLARNVSSHLRYSANATQHDASARIRRVSDNPNFLHLDFKKYGLTIPREVTNTTIRTLGEYAGIDVDILIIHSFIVEMEDGNYETERGTMLGWLDSINSIAISAILLNLSRTTGVKFDHVIFNDDVEIGHKFMDEFMETLRELVLIEFATYDILVSEKKTYNSKMMIFLEEYDHTRRVNLNMKKIQLCVLTYAKSLVQPTKWKAKVYYALGELLVKNNYADLRCKAIEPEFGHETEFTDPLWAGGWHIPIIDNLDWSLEKAGRLRCLGAELMKWTPPKMTSKVQECTKTDILYKTHESHIVNASPSRAKDNRLPDTSEDTEDLETLLRYVETKVEIETLPEKVASHFLRALERVRVGLGVT